MPHADPKPRRLLPLVPLLALLALAAVAAAPGASAFCTEQPTDPTKPLLCASAAGHPTGTCFSYYVNPPLPGTATGGWVCQPAALCGQPCVIDVCVRSACFATVILEGTGADT